MNNFVTIDKKLSFDALEWAKTHCPNYITNDCHMIGYELFDQTRVDFFFADNDQGRKEMTLFALRWV